MKHSWSWAVLLAFASVVPLAGQEEKKGDMPPDGLKALKHPDPAIRYRAIELLIRLGKVGKIAIPELREALDDKNPYIRVKAAEALWVIEQPPLLTLMPVLQSALRDMEPQVRVRAITLLAQMKSEAEEVLPLLMRGLKDKDLDVKMESVNALGDFGPAAKDAAFALLNLSKEDDFLFLEPVVGAALGNLGPETIPVLARALKDTSAKKRLALFALGSMKIEAKNAIEAIVPLLAEKDAVLRGQAALALGKIGLATPAVQEKPALCLQDPDPLVQLYAAQTLWVLVEKPEAHEVLARFLSDEEDGTCLRAIAVVGELGPKGAKFARPLAGFFKSKNDLIRLAAVESLGKVGPAAKDTLPDVRSLLAEKDDLLRVSATFSLWQITTQPGESLPLFEKTLSHEDEAVRRKTVGCLRSMEGAARPLFAKLAERWSEEAGEMKQAIAQALKAIDPVEAAKAVVR